MAFNDGLERCPGSLQPPAETTPAGVACPECGEYVPVNRQGNVQGHLRRKRQAHPATTARRNG